MIGLGVLVLVAGGCSRDEEEGGPTETALESTVERPAPSGVSYAPAPLAGYTANPPQGLAQPGYRAGVPGYGQAPGTAPYGYPPAVDGTGYGVPGTQGAQPAYAQPGIGDYRDGTGTYPSAQPPLSGVAPGAGGDYYYIPSSPGTSQGYGQVTQPGAGRSGFGSPTQPGAWSGGGWQGASGSAHPPSPVTHPSGVAPGPLPQETPGVWPQVQPSPQSDLYPSLDYDPTREARAQQAAPTAPVPATPAPVTPATPTVPAWGGTAAVPTTPVYPYGGYGTYGVTPGLYPPAYTAPLQPWAGLFPFVGGLPVW